jgi:tetratricopeptide (TPR) repeat protein
VNVTEISTVNIFSKIGLTNDFIRSLEPSIKRINYRAALNWLKHSRGNKAMDSNTPESQQIKGLLEAIHHLCEVNNPVASVEILREEIQTTAVALPNLPLYEYLLHKGQSKQLSLVTDKILNLIKNETIDKKILKIIKARASDNLGDREIAIQIYEDVCSKSSLESREYIEAYSRLAISQIQMGGYKAGVVNLDRALNNIKSIDGYKSDSLLKGIESEIVENLAFYQMNIGSFDKALTMYDEVIRLRESSRITNKLVFPLAHKGIILRKSAVSRKCLIQILAINTLCLLNIPWLPKFLKKKFSYRSKQIIDRNYEKAENALSRAYELCEELNDDNSKSWIAHHLAWTLVNRGQSSLAVDKALTSLDCYQEIEDRRGISDCYEQLGRIYLTKDVFDIRKAENCFKRSLQIRQDIKNHHGVASSTLNFSFLYWHQGLRCKSLNFLKKAMQAYHKIGILNTNRIFAILALFSVWTVGDRDWTA